MTNAEKIFLARVQAGLTQQKLAKLAGVPQSSVARLESGDIKGKQGTSFDRVWQVLSERVTT